MNMKPPFFVAALCMMAHLLPLPASTLAREGMITTDDYATFLKTPEGEEGETSPFLEIEGAMHRQDCYDEKMAEDVGSSCLMRRGEPGNYFYECTGGTSSTPLHFMSALDAELYCKWNNSALAPSPHASSERDPLLKTNITTFPIQIAHDGTQGTSLHQAMGEEEIIEPCILETLEEIIGLVVVSGALGENSLHARAHERASLHLTPEFNNSLRLAQSTREIHEETHQIDGFKGVNNSAPSMIHQAVPPASLVPSHLDPDLVNNSLFRNVGATSPQDQFEEAIEMIRGEGLFYYDFPEGGEPVRVKAKLDGRTMLGQLAEGKIKFPLETASLKETGLEEIFHNIGFALKDNIEEIDKKIADLKRTTANQGTASSDLVERTEHLETYKEALETGRHLLQDAPENADNGFFQTLMSNLHETFTLCEQAEEKRAAGNDEGAEFLTYQSRARLGATKELARPEPRANIIAGFNDAFTLLQRAEGARDAGNLGLANNFNNQASARLAATEMLMRPVPAAACSIS